MRKIILFAIKALVTFLVLIAISLVEEAGFLYILSMLIGVFVILAVWRYNPEQKANTSELEDLKKD